jgi:hypothetical protein
VIGFDVDETTVLHYRARVDFRSEPSSIQTSDELPWTNGRVIVWSGLNSKEVFRFRVMARRRSCAFQKIGSLAALLEALAELFPAPKGPRWFEPVRPIIPNQSINRVREVRTGYATLNHQVQRRLVSADLNDPRAASKRIAREIRKSKIPCYASAVRSSIQWLKQKAGIL